MASLTSSPDDERQSIIDSTVSSAAYLGWRRYRSFLTISDARQAAYEWTLSHRRQVDELLEDGERGRRRLHGRLIRHVTKVARAEKAERSGYKPDDESFYSRAVIESILPAVYDPNYRPWTPDDQVGRTRKNGTAYLEWETMVADIRAAMEKGDVTQEELAILRLRFGQHLLLTHIGVIFEVSEGTIRNRIDSAIRGIQAYLGGPEPRGCDDGCEDCSHIGQRRSISNAEARAITASYYESD